MVCVPASLLDSSTGYGWSIIVVWDPGACWMDRYWATNLSCCVFAVVVSFGGMDLVYWEEGNLGLRGVDQEIIDIRDIILSEEDLSRLEILWVALNEREPPSVVI